MASTERECVEVFSSKIEINERRQKAIELRSKIPQTLVGSRTRDNAQRRGFHRVTHILFAMLAPTVLTVTVSCSSGDGHHEDASFDTAFDVAISDDGGWNDGRDAAADGNANGGQNSCLPLCTPLQVCCVDQHGHFPICVDGVACRPPQKPANGG